MTEEEEEEEERHVGKAREERERGQLLQHRIMTEMMMVMKTMCRRSMKQRQGGLVGLTTRGTCMRARSPTISTHLLPRGTLWELQDR